MPSSLISFILLATGQGYKLEFEEGLEGESFETLVKLSRTHRGILFEDKFLVSNMLLETQGELALGIMLAQMLTRIKHTVKFYDYPDSKFNN